VVADAGQGLADPLEEADGECLPRLDVDQLVLDRRRPGVDDEDVLTHVVSLVLLEALSAWAWMAVIATVLTMSCTRAPRERSLTGFRRPWSTGPIATAPADRCTSLEVLLPVFRSGKTT